ncbi:hypothetical protein B0H13DRAFT_1867653 [Mycena leptocephala]|nr:hypothetical protein B0H13DRAFT_1867653 [Mycena leptocephala]
MHYRSSGSGKMFNSLVKFQARTSASDSEFWSSKDLPHFSTAAVLGDDAVECQVEMVESWLRKSGSLPLSIQMREPVDGVWPELLAHRTRWEYVKLIISVDRCTIDGPMPFLRQLAIHDTYGQSIAVVLRDAPLLRTVTLFGVNYSLGYLPLSQLASLSLVGTTPTESWPILQEAVNLAHCELMLCGEGILRPHLYLPHLKSLALWVFDRFSQPLTQSLDPFVVPALRTL